MMDTGLWVQRDAAQIVRDAIRKHCDDPTMVRSDVPDKWTRKNKPVVVVTSDGTPEPMQSYTTEMVRVTVYARDIVQARKIMTSVDAFLMTPWYQVQALTTIDAATGLMVIKDSKSGGAGLASAVYNVRTSKISKR